MKFIADENYFKGHNCPSWSKCDEYPCRHTPSHDPDWLADRSDKWTDFKAWQQLWHFFWDSEDREELDSHNFPDLQQKLDRCLRLVWKKDKILEDRKQHYKLMKIELDLHERGRKEGVCTCGCGLPAEPLEPLDTSEWYYI
jgi:hypothetical protein